MNTTITFDEITDELMSDIFDASIGSDKTKSYDSAELLTDWINRYPQFKAELINLAVHARCFDRLQTASDELESVEDETHVWIRAKAREEILEEVLIYKKDYYYQRC